MSPLKRQVEQQQPLQRRTVKPTQKRKAKKKGLYSLQGLVGMTVYDLTLSGLKGYILQQGISRA